MANGLIEIPDQVLTQIRDELPEIEEIGDAETRRRVALVWGSFLLESSYTSIGEALAFPGMTGFDLARHTRHVVKNCIFLADTLKEFWAVDCDRDDLTAAALCHDASKLVEMHGPAGEPTELGQALPHAQLAGVRCAEAGLSFKVVYLVSYHPFTPPHVHLKPKYMEMVILSWADLAAVDPLFHLAGLPTHLDIGKRFFRLD